MILVKASNLSKDGSLYCYVIEQNLSSPDIYVGVNEKNYEPRQEQNHLRLTIVHGAEQNALQSKYALFRVEKSRSSY